MMKSLTFFCSAIISILFTISLSAQVTVTVTGAGNTTPNLSASYASLNAALTDLNAINAMSGPVVLTCAAGSETAPSSAGFTLGSSSLNPLLSATNTITLTVSGIVTLNAAVGISTPASVAPDGIFKIVGADWVTINGLTFTDGNATNPESMEFGLALFKMDAGDGAQNNTIQNCTFNMQRGNFASGTSPMVEGSVCLLTINSTPTAATTVLIPSSAAGTNSNNKYYTNTANGGNYGIVLSGYAAATPFTLGDTNNDIGGSDFSTGNIIRNYGGGTASGNPAAGIRANNQWGINISYNDVDNNDGGGVDHPSTLRGIYGQAGTSANATINFNTVSIKGGGTSSQLTGIEVAIGSTAASNTVDVNNNTIQNSTYTTATSGTFRAIAIASSPAMLNANNNTVINNNTPGTGQFDCIIMSSTPTNFNCNFNTVDGNLKTGTGIFNGIYASGSSTSMTVTFRGNAITNNQIQGASGTLYCMRGTTSMYTLRENTISANRIPNTSGATTSSAYGYSNAGSPISEEIFENDIFDLSIEGASTSTSSLFYGISLSTSSSSNKNIYNNRIRNLQYLNSSTGAATIIGISQALALSANIYSNNIYDLIATNGATSLVRGIQISSGTTLNVYNNLIGNLQASASASADALRGINITSTSTSSNLNISYNTIYLNGTSSGTNFGSQGLFHTYSTTATTAVLNMRNNIISNLSTANGTGLTVAFRRSAATNLNNYGTVSNNNLFYAGTPSATNLIYYDGINSDQTLAAFKARVTPRESGSISESPNFVSTTGSDPNFLHIDTGIGTQIESGGINIAGIASDFDGDARNGTTPDIGADEFSGIGIDLTPPIISYTPLSNSSCIEDKTLTPVSVTDASGVNITAGTRPRMYFKKSSHANTVNDNTTATDGWKYVEASGVGDTPFSFTTDFTLLFGGAGVVVGDTIQYFVVAQDNAGTPNVGINTGSFASNPTSVALMGAHFPISGTLNQFIFVSAGLSGTKTIGAAGDYPTLTGVGGLFEAINNGGMSAGLTVTILDASVTETGATALNGINYNGCAAGPYPLTIKPSATSVLTGAVGAGALIKLNGADNVTIDGSNSGGNDRSLTIQNMTATTSGNAVIWLAAPASGNGSNDNIIKNCIIEGNSMTTSFLGAFIGGSTTISLTAAGSESNNNNSVTNNLFRKTQNGLAMFGYSTSFPDLNNAVTNNNFGTSTAGEGFALIGMNANRQQNLVVSGNEVQNVTNATTSLNMFGIRLLDFKNGMCFNNNIHDMLYTGASTPKLYGINVASSSYNTVGNPSNALIYNNTVSKINSSGISAVWNVSGILANVGYGDRYYHNSVHLTGQLASSSAGLVAAFANGDGNISTVCTNIDVQNNIFNIEGSNSVAGGNFWAYYTKATSLAGSTINYNDLNCAGTNVTNNVGSFNSVNYVTLADWQTATSQDLNSVTITPVFASATDLHLPIASNVALNNLGTPLAAVTTDIDGDMRDVSTPDMGADEFVVTSCAGMPVAGSISPVNAVRCANQTYTMTATGITAGLGITYQWKTGPSGGPYVNVSGGNGATTPSYTTGALVTGTYYFILETTCTNSGLSNITNEFSLLVNPNPTAIISPTGPTTICAPATQLFTASTDIGDTYRWKKNGVTIGGETTSSYTANSTGSYQIVVSIAATLCKDSSTLSTLSVNEAPTTSISATPASICTGENSQLNVSVSSVINKYAFSAGTGSSLDPMAGSTSVLGTSNDDTPMAAPANIGFTFNYNGTDYTQFSASPDGWIMFGGTTAVSQFTNSTTSTTNVPKLYPYWDDLATGTDGGVETLLTGTTPNQIFIVQWRVTIPRNTTGPFNSTFQAWIYEGSNKIEFRYGTMGTATSTSISGGLTAGGSNYQSLTFTTNSVSTTTVNDANTITPPIGTIYTFDPGNFTYNWSPSGNLNASNVANPLASALAATTKFYVTVTNTITTCTKLDSVTVNVSSGPSITTQPAPFSGCLAGDASFNVVANGAGLMYQWKKDNNILSNGGNISGATSPTLSISSITGADAGVYTVEVSATCGSPILSDGTSILTVSPNPTASISPTGPTTICAPNTQLFTSSTDIGTAYQWKKNGIVIPMADMINYTANTSGDYRVIITVSSTGCKDSSAISTLIVNQQPSTIFLTPASPAICSGDVQQLVATGGLITTSDTIGNGVLSNTTSTPYKGFWGGSKVQFLFTAVELTSLGMSGGTSINSISMSVSAFTSPYTFNGFTIAMKNTSTTALTTTLETGTTTVLNPVNYVLSGTAPFVVSHTFNSEFNWDGTSNLLVEYCFNNVDGGGVSANSANVVSHTAGGTYTSYYSSDNNATVCSAPGTATTSTTRPNTIFGFNVSATKLWSPVTDLFTDVSATIPYTGENIATVYAKPASTTTFTFTVTSATSCTNTSSVTVGVTGDEVLNESNDGTGSLRKAIECTAAGDTVFISNGSVNNINLLTQLSIDKQILLLDDNGSAVNLVFDFTGGGLMNETTGGLKVGNLGNVTLDNMHIIHVNNDATHPVVRNEGILTLRNSKITGQAGNTIPPYVQNAGTGSINAEGTTEIKNE